MTHTLETLLPLLDKDGNPINQEASDKLRVWAAELDDEDSSYQCPQHGTVPSDRIGDAMGCPWCGSYCERQCPEYSTSLDAIYAAEKRAGLHDDANFELRDKWEMFMAEITQAYIFDHIDAQKLAFATPAQRNLALILTLQQKQTL